MNRKRPSGGQPSKEKRRPGTGAVPPESRARSPAQGKRNAKAIIARDGRQAASQRETDREHQDGEAIRSSRRESHREQQSRTPDGQKEEENADPVPGDRLIGSSKTSSDSRGRFFHRERPVLRTLDSQITSHQSPITNHPR